MFKRFLFLLPACLLAACSLVSRPAVITHPDTETLYWNGPIDFDDDKRFEAMLTPQTKRLIIRSGGGEVTAALRMGLLIHQRGLDVQVSEVCGSSCANYIFLAGRHKIVPRGAYVGFHGDPDSSPAILALRERTKNSSDPKDIKFQAYTQESNRLSKEFYEAIGINPKLYAYSAQFTLANNVAFWVPSPRELECMNVQGLDMWFSDQTRDFTNRWTSVATSAQDKRQPHPDICVP